MRHFTPDYNPWDQRLCVVPDGDLFKVLREGKASVETDHIESFTEKGIKLKSGKELEADIIVTATGLEVQMLPGVEVTVDGNKLPLSETLTYKGVLIEGIPNAGVIFGYTNASWTLKVDIACTYLTRIMKHMDRKGYNMMVARDLDGNMTDNSAFDGLNSGYVKRAANRLPRQGKAAPWRGLNDYLTDAPMLKTTPLEDVNLQFSKRTAKPKSGKPATNGVGAEKSSQKKTKIEAV